jgi:hypothetical protein
MDQPRTSDGAERLLKAYTIQMVSEYDPSE